MRTHCVHHPQSVGAIERENCTIKTKLNKVGEETGLNWIKALPSVLMSMRGQGKAKTGLNMGWLMNTSMSFPGPRLFLSWEELNCCINLSNMEANLYHISN